MKLKNIKIIIIIIVLLLILSGCTAKNEDIMVEAGTYEYSYIEVIEGKNITYIKEIIEDTPITIILNGWISDLNEKNINYGNNPNGNSILKSLEVKSAYLEGNTIIIIMNKDFANFEGGYSQPIYLIDGLRDILRQVTEVSYFSIEVEGYNNSIIHPDGVILKDIPIRSQENNKYEENNISNEAKMFVEEQFSGNMQYLINKTTKEIQDYFKKNGLHSEYVQYQLIGQVRVAKISNMEYLAIVTVYVRNLDVGIDTHIFENITLEEISGEWLVVDIAYDI